MKAHTLLLALVLAFSVVHASDQKEGVAPVTHSGPLGSKQTTGPSTPQFLPGIVVIEGSASEGTTRTPESSETRTTEQRARLDTLAYEIFEPKVPGLEYRYERVKSKDLFARFGEPTIKSVGQYRHIDPLPNAPTYIQTITWQFPGMVVEVSAYPPSPTHAPQHVWLSRVEISSPKYRLSHGLGVSQSLAAFVSKLGEPTGQYASPMRYSVNEEIEDGPGYYYRISLSLDADGKVKKIEWDW